MPSPAPASPTRVHIVNTGTGESVEALFNPTGWSLGADVNYARISPPGLDHAVLQYLGTNNRTISSIVFALDKVLAAEDVGDPDIQDFRRFIEALTVPPAGTGGPADTRPPRAMFVWPKVLTMEVVVTRYEFAFTDFGEDGDALAYTATLSFEEYLGQRRTSEELRRGV